MYKYFFYSSAFVYIDINKRAGLWLKALNVWFANWEAVSGLWE